MNTIFKSSIRLLLLMISLNSFFIGCKKDGFTESGQGKTMAIRNNSFLSQPISLEEARNYYNQINSHSDANLNESGQIHLVKINPDWDNARVDSSIGGRPMVVVPLTDTELRDLNNGMTTANVLFSRINEDTITAELLISIADSAYFANNHGIVSLENYTGWFLFFDISEHFNYGVNVINGTPTGKITGLHIKETIGATADDRSDEDCISIFDSQWMQIPCPMAEDGCYDIGIVTVDICDDNGGVYGGGGSGGGSGGGTGGGTGGGGAGGGHVDTTHTTNSWAFWVPLIQSGQITYWQLWLYGIPEDIFKMYGGHIPTPAESSLFHLNSICSFNSSQLLWLQNHSSLLSYISSFLDAHNNEQSYINALKDVIDARMGGTEFFSWASMAKLIEVQKYLNITQDQLKWLIDNSKTSQTDLAIDVVYSFLQSKNFAPEAITVAQFMVQLKVANEIPINAQSGGFQQLLADYPEVSQGQQWPGPDLGTLWTIAYEIEKAELKYGSPHRYEGTWGDWQLAFDAAWNVSIEGIHTALDGIGLVPVVGEVADISNGILYYFEGDWSNGTLSVIAAVPLIGEAATSARFAQKIVNAAGNICKLNWIDDGVRILFGNRDQLRRILKPLEGFQAHHLIPWEFTENTIIQKAARGDGITRWHMNEAVNGLSISEARHLGSHANYNNAIASKLSQIEQSFPDMSNELAREKCEYLATEVKKILEQNSSLMVNDPQIANLIQQIPIH